MKNLNVMVIGAHPDDCEGGCGGTALKYVKAGSKVTFVSVTDGSAGHQTLGRQELAKIRKEEAQASANISGVTSIVLKHRDGELEPNLEARKEMVRLIRTVQPDIIITHRLNDYHPDHRSTSQIVEDSSYLVMVPAICPDTPALNHQPAIFFVYDPFQRPYPFSADIVVRIDDVMEEKLKMTGCHKSQYEEFLPWMAIKQGEIQADYDVRNYPSDAITKWDRKVAERYQDALKQRYGQGSTTQYAEAYEMSEYGMEIPRADLDEYFPR